MLTRTCKSVDFDDHCSSGLHSFETRSEMNMQMHNADAYRPGQVPSRERQTLPLLYKLGLNLTLPPPVVRRCMSGGLLGYSMGMKQSNSNSPPSYGVPCGPAIMIF